MAVTAQEIEAVWYERMGALPWSDPLNTALAVPIFIWPLLMFQAPLYPGSSTRVLLACGAVLAYAFIAQEAWRVWVKEEIDKSPVKQRILVLRVMGAYGLNYLLDANGVIFSSLWINTVDTFIVRQIVCTTMALGYVATIALTLLGIHWLGQKGAFNWFLPHRRDWMQIRSEAKYVWPISVAMGLLWVIAAVSGLRDLDLLVRLSTEMGLLIGGFYLLAGSTWLFYQFGVLAWAGISDALKRGDT
jgi:hypothetical protein